MRRGQFKSLFLQRWKNRQQFCYAGNSPLLGVCPGTPVSYCSPVLSRNSGPGDFEDDHIRFLQFSARKQDLSTPGKAVEGSKSDSPPSRVLPDISSDLCLPENCLRTDDLLLNTLRAESFFNLLLPLYLYWIHPLGLTFVQRE